eukprot:gene23241-30124_t
MESSQAQGLIVIPGLGRADRLNNVVSNLELLKSFIKVRNSIHWDCVVYAYASRLDHDFWNMESQLGRLRTYCNIIENPRGKVTENMYLAQPALIRSHYELVFLLLDDIKLQAAPGTDSFPLDKLLKIMRGNNLTVLSPMISGANKVGGNKFRQIMQAPAAPDSEGTMGTVFPSINPYGWGHDFWYDGYAKKRVPGHKMGIASTVVVIHDQNERIVGAGRTDNTRIEDKWNAVLAQERHYKQYLGINLAQFRKNLDLSNSSWNGAVKGIIPKL